MNTKSEQLKIYDDLISHCPRFERKGKTMFFCSANGHMFSILNKAGEIGIRFSKKVQSDYLEKYNTTTIKSYGSVMQGYILVTSEMLKNQEGVVSLLNESYDYVMFLESK